MSKHTPGPWIVDDRHVHPENGLVYSQGHIEDDVIVCVDTDARVGGLLSETDKANLRLISAAPDLLEACKAFVKARRLWRSQDESETIDSVTYLDMLDAIEFDAAIAKAEGGAKSPAPGSDATTPDGRFVSGDGYGGERM